MPDPSTCTGVILRHAEYKIPGGKLLVVDLRVEQSRLRDVRLSGDFFLEPPETLEAIDAALEGLSADVTAGQIEQAARSALGPEVMMYGITTEGIAEVIRRALA
jgi:hypothetical protein